MTIGAQNELDEIDFQIIVGLCLRKTQAEVGAWVSTPEKPAGISERTVRNRIEQKQVAYDRLRAHFGASLNQQRIEFEAITKQEYREKLETLRAKSVAVKELALDSALSGGSLELGVKVADSIEDREFGKASQVHKHEGDVNVSHQVVWKPQDVRMLIRQERDIADSDDLLKFLPGEVLEGELVATT